ncbi:unnamed protein product [Tetraodon nigroviridis]|uniref:(spotted green pufferfish) hypothetical protein n=1 Tax=Tetraodon nigroviridis TaxID=99883 RepID=Q4RN38_TETNG|nr:unnamed protein product [Tetraodon nigroviridis]
MRVSHSKTEYMCLNERHPSGRLRLQRKEIKKVEDFKYLGSPVQSNGEYGKELGFDRKWSTAKAGRHNGT